MALDELSDACASRRRTLDALFADTVAYSPVAPAVGPIGRSEIADRSFAIPVQIDAPGPAHTGAPRTLRADLDIDGAPGSRTWLRSDVRVGSQPLRLDIVVDARSDATRAAQASEAPDVMDLAEAARFLRISAGKLRTLAQRGDAPAARIGRALRFRKAALLDWLRLREEQRQEAARAVPILRTVTGSG